jgi:CO/xanthine dehydrogenase Mo-binding subunit
VAVESPEGARATAVIGPDGNVRVTVAAGEVLDEVVLRSYALGAVHQALGWVLSEGVATDPEGNVLDLTIRSFGILSARAMPAV